MLMLQNLLTPIFRIAKKRRSLPFVPLVYINDPSQPPDPLAAAKPERRPALTGAIPSPRSNQFSS